MKVTTKGQVTIPARIREYLDIAPHSDVDFRVLTMKARTSPLTTSEAEFVDIG